MEKRLEDDNLPPNSNENDIIIYETYKSIDLEKKLDNYKYGLIISDSNKWIIPAIYDKISLEYPDEFEKREIPRDHIVTPYFSAYLYDKNIVDYFYFLRLKTKTLLLKVKSLKGLKTNWGDFYQYKLPRRIGYMNSTGEFILETETEENADLNNSNSSLITWNKNNGNYELIHLIKKKKIPLELNNNIEILYAFQEDYTVIEWNGKLGLINLLGDITVPCQFEEILDIINQQAIAKLDSKYGVISCLNRKVIEFKYDEITFLDSINGYLTEIGGNFGLITREGYEILPTIYDKISKIYSSKNYYRVVQGKNVGFANSRKITALIYEETPAFIGYTQFSEGLLRVKKNGKIGYLNEDLEEIIPCIYNEGSIAKDGRILVMIEHSLKFINVFGENLDYNPELAMKYTFENNERMKEFRIS